MAFFAFLVLFVTLWAFGDRLAGWLGLSSGPGLERFGLSLSLGYGSVTLIVFAAAAFRVFSFATAALIAAAMLAVGFRNLPRLAAGLRDARERRPWRRVWPPKATAEVWVLLLTLAAYALGFVVALAPPTGMDAGVYHFTIPKVILREGGLVPRDDIWIHKFGGFYMVYAFGMALGGEILAKLMAFGAAVAGGCLAGAAAERVERGAGRWAAFAFASTPLVVSYVGTEWLEIPVLMYVLAGLLCLLRTLEAGEARWAVLACAFAGFTLSSKPSAFAPAFLAPAALAILLVRRRARAWPAAALGAAVFAATAGFWALWNLATTGGPLYRYAGTSFDAVAPAGPSISTLAAGILKTLGAVATSGTYWDDSAGPFVIAGVAGAAVFMARGSARWPLALFTLGVLIHIGVLAVLSPGHLLDTRWTGRYMAPVVIGLGAPVAGLFAAWARARGGLLGIAVTAAMLLPAFPLLLLKAGKAAVAAPAAVGLESRSAYLGKKIETFDACEAVGRIDRADVKVLFMGYRPYYLDRPFVHALDGTHAPFFLDVRGPEEFVRKLRSRRITHVLYEPQRAEQAAWLGDPERFFSSTPPFRTVGRWAHGNGTLKALLVEVGP